MVDADEVHEFEAMDLIERVLDIRAHADSQILVLNSAVPHLLLLNTDGTLVVASGASGGGPGELRRPMTLLGSDTSGTAWVYDAGKRSLVGTDPTGSRDASGEIRLPTDVLPPSRLVSTESLGTLLGRPWMQAADNEFLIARSELPFGSPLALRIWQSELVALRADGTTRPLFSVRARLRDPLPQFGGTGEYLPYPLWDRCASGMIVMYDPIAHTVRRFSAAGEELTSARLPPPKRLELTRDRYWQMLLPALIAERRDTAAFRRSFAEQWAQGAKTFANVFPEYVDLHCADDVVWLQQFDQAGLMGHGPTWTALATDDIMVDYRFPAAFRALRFASDRIWGVVSDELGVESVAWVRIR